jgi:hypothetical protein
VSGHGAGSHKALAKVVTTEHDPAALQAVDGRQHNAAGSGLKRVRTWPSPPLSRQPRWIQALALAKGAVNRDLGQGALENASSWSSNFPTNRSETLRRWTGAATVRRSNPQSVSRTTTPRVGVGVGATNQAFTNEAGDPQGHAGA